MGQLRFLMSLEEFFAELKGTDGRGLNGPSIRIRFQSLVKFTVDSGHHKINLYSASETPQRYSRNDFEATPLYPRRCEVRTTLKRSTNNYAGIQDTCPFPKIGTNNLPGRYWNH